MHRTKIFIMLIFIPLQLAFANCDLTRFRWECDLKIYPKPTRGATSLVYCGSSYGYVTPANFDILSHYHRRSINMVLKINGEFVEAPCIPGRR